MQLKRSILALMVVVSLCLSCGYKPNETLDKAIDYQLGLSGEVDYQEAKKLLTEATETDLWGRHDPLAEFWIVNAGH